MNVKQLICALDSFPANAKIYIKNKEDSYFKFKKLTLKTELIDSGKHIEATVFIESGERIK